MKDPTNKRKVEHINIINKDQNVDRKKFYFDNLSLVHRALPEIDYTAIDTSVELFNKRLSFPLLISSMTGGDHELVRTINRNLAIAAQETQVALGVGSQRVAFTHPGARSSFELRKYAPNALLFANLGAVQLNYGFTIEHCRKAVDMLQADALIFHLNPLQEAVQPEGDTNFANLAVKIAAIAEQLEVPVILKEVGAGISAKDVSLLIDKGVHYIDVAGSGGTSWSRIEHYRHSEGKNEEIGITFQDWGLSTPMAIKALQKYRDQMTVIASGGLRNGIDMVKAIILGARLCGLASPFLQPAMESQDQVIERIIRLKREFQTAMFLLGVAKFDDLHFNPDLLIEP
jgi:isopentenyl-diphosphate delta-isomerase